MQLDERAPALVSTDAPTSAPWLRNAWYAVTWAAELTAGKLLARTILNEPLVIFRQPDGAVVALADYCPHRFAPLHIGKMLPDGRLQCGYHGLEFDATGRCVRNPHGDGKIPPSAAVASYPIVEKYGVAWIWMGTATPSEEFADYSMFSDVAPLFQSIQDYLFIEAPYTAVQDNLLDASHVSYVHPGALGNVDMVATAETTLEQRGDQVEVSRFSSDVPVPSILDLQFRSGGVRADKWNTIRWDPPGNILVFAGVTGRGAERASGTGYYGMHLLTPETETTTHYHFWAARWNVRDTDEATTLAVRKSLDVSRRQAFEEQDAPVIEAQNRVRARLGPAARPALLSVDAAAVRARRVLEARIARESESRP